MAGQISHPTENKRLKETGSEDTHGLPGDIITAAQIVFNNLMLVEIILRFVVEPGSPRWWTTRLPRVNYAFNQILMKITSTGKITLLMSLRGKKAQDDDEGRDVHERMTLRTMEQYLQYRRTYLPIPFKRPYLLESNYIQQERIPGLYASFIFGHDLRFATWDPSLTTITAYTDERKCHKKIEFYFRYTPKEGMTYEIVQNNADLTQNTLCDATEDIFYTRLQTYMANHHAKTLRERTPGWFEDADATGAQGLVAMMHHMVVG
jgi:hypothetical protein